MSIQAILLYDIEHGGPFNQPDQVIRQLVEFIQAAQRSLYLAIYDFRLNPHGKYYAPIVNALRERAQAGVDIRIAYDHGKPQGFRAALTPLPLVRSCSYRRRSKAQVSNQEGLLTAIHSTLSPS